ncbi:MAG: YitT family protein [Niameybacter sp.]|uniref:YitT family protein n=1 Tax=Niameybacter sp. TaxID=2033640 RepID=UPI002FC6CA86
MYTRLKHIPFKSIGLVLAGATILSFGTFNFNYQNNITEGGVLGLLLLFKNLFDISPSLTNIILDFSLFLLGARFFGKRFLIYSLFSTITFSTTYRIWESIGPIAPDLSEHMLTASLLAGLFVGVGVGLVVLGGGASGGDDVIALLGSKFTPLKLNWVYMITDFTVLILSLSYLRFEQIFWSLIAVTVSGKVISLIHAKGESASCSNQDVEQTTNEAKEFAIADTDVQQAEALYTQPQTIQVFEEYEG